MKVLIANLPWRTKDFDSKKLTAAKAGSRWPHFGYSREEKERDCTVPPLFLGSAANLIRRKHEVVFIDAIATGESMDEFINKTESIRPDVVLTETSTPSIASDVSLLCELKKRLGCHTIICGSHVSVFPQEASAVDTVVQGEYEFSALGVIENLSCATPPPDLILPKSLRDINDIPFPAWDLMPMDAYLHNNMSWSGGYPEIEFMTSRGCPFKCTFCLWPQILFEGKVRTIEPRRVVDEIQFLIRAYGVRGIYFNDDTFTASKPHVLGICNEILSRNIKIKWACFGHCSTVDSQMLKAMKEAGCTKIKYGIESGCDDILKKMRKGTNRQTIERAFNITEKAGIEAHASFTIGFPDDDRETILETIKFAKKVNPVSAVFSLVTPYPGTKLFEECEKEGLIVTKDWTKYQGAFTSVVRTKFLDSEEIAKLGKYAIYAWERHYALRQLKSIFNILRQKGLFYVIKKSFQKLLFLMRLDKNSKEAKC